MQRACLARALIPRPRYFVCDELSSILDISTQASLPSAIAAEEAERQLGILRISHDLVLVNHWCDNVIELSHPSAQLALRQVLDQQEVRGVSPDLDYHLLAEPQSVGALEVARRMVQSEIRSLGARTATPTSALWLLSHPGDAGSLERGMVFYGQVRALRQLGGLNANAGEKIDGQDKDRDSG